MKRLATTLTLSCLVSMPLASQATARLAFDSIMVHRLPRSACYVGARYVVVERDLERQVGADLLVRQRGAPNTEPQCGVDSVAGDIVFRTGDIVSNHPDAQHFLGLKHHLLLAW